MTARKSKGWLIVNVGPPGRYGKKLRAIRESEGPGICDYCGNNREKGAMYSYSDAGNRYCNKECFKADILTNAGLRAPSHSQVARQNRAARKKRVEKQHSERTSLGGGVVIQLRSG
jgi:hypothetical protein